MVKIVEVNEKNQVVEHYCSDVVLPGGDVITLNPGVPPLGSDAFTAWLADWHEVHNPQMIAIEVPSF